MWEDRVGSQYETLVSSDDRNVSGSLPTLPNFVEVPICHVQQEHNWDCGIACIAMVLSEQDRSKLLSKLDTLGEEEGFRNSVWTIDLAYLLKKYNVPHVFYTVTVGVDPGYTNEDFYTRVIDLDQERVQRRFDSASDCSIEVSQRSLGLKEIVNHVSTMQPAIVLVDSNRLKCDLCTSLFKMLSCCPLKVPYAGHFVVICGYDLDKKKILYRNPSHKNRVCSTSFDDFEIARHSYGTDDDIILIGSA